MRTESGFRIYNAEGFGQAVRYFREEAGLTQAELAARLGMRRPTLVAIENGQMTEQVRRIVELLKELGIRLHASPESW